MLGTPPSGAIFLLVVNPDRTVQESDASNDQNNVLSIPVQPDLAATSLAWDTAQGGVDFGYSVKDAALTQDTTAALYWATGTNYDTRIGDPLYDTTIEHPVGNYGPFYVPNSSLGTPPADARYLLLAVNPDKTVHESDEANDTNNLLSLLNAGDTTTTVTSSAPLFSVYGQRVTFTATVQVTAPGGGIPTGTVTFKNDSKLGSPALGPPAQLSLNPDTNLMTAVFTTNKLGVGANFITAVYSGDSNFTTSTSTTLLQTVVPDGTTTSIASSANPSVFGQPITFTATVTAGTSPGAARPLASSPSWTVRIPWALSSSATVR